MARTIFKAWALFLEEMPSGFPTASLGSDDLRGAAELLNLDTFLDGVGQIAATRDIDSYCFLHRVHLTSFAGRCLLGRLPEQIERLRSLWVNNGASERVVDLAVEAARIGSGPGRIIEARSEANAALYSPAHADFVGKLADIERTLEAGTFGEAIRGSRYAVGEGGDRHFLAGESRLPIGFPVVRLAEARPEFGFRDFAWVEPVSKWPVWLADHEAASAADPLQGPRHERLNKVRVLLSSLEESVHEALDNLGLPGDPERPTGIALPDWLTLYALDFGFEGLDSAGLALAFQRLSDNQGRPIPAGVGFTGSWRDGRLQAVRGIRGKLRAAREAGIFILFACVNQGEVEEVHQQGPEPGVTLVLLPAGSSLDDVLVRVNTVCHDLGLTEYRWRRAVKTWENRVRGRRGEASLSRLLPDAAEKTCPVGFVGREDLLSELDRRKEGTESGHVALIGSPRSGKTTALSRWVFHRPGVWQRLPVWFSFVRGLTGASTLGDLEGTLIDQIRARYCVLESRQSEDTPRPLYELMQSMADPAGFRIDLVIDGLDEAEAGDQMEIAELLMSLPGGLLVVGTQDVVAANVFQNRVMIGDYPDHGDAGTLVSGFAERFTGSGESRQIREIGSSLETEDWRRELIEKSGGHLWILTEFLSWIERKGGEPWPDTPEGLERHLANGVKDYCDLICKDVAQSAEGGWEKLRSLLVTLAVLENRPWLVSDVMALAKLSVCSDELNRSQDLIHAHALRLVEVEPQSRRIQFRDSYFQEYLRKPNDLAAREVTCRLVRLIGQRPGGDYSEDLIRYAIARSAWHVSNDANELAAKLVPQTSWASARFGLLAIRREGDPSLDELIEQMVADLVRLEPLVQKETKKALRDLRRAIGDWRWAIRQSPELSPGWWKGLEAVQAHEIWLKQGPESTHHGSESRTLLVPHTGYPTIRPRQLRLCGAACELADGRIVLVDTLNRFDQRLLIIDSENGNIEASHTLENIPPIRHIAACGREHILLATELDRSGRALILRIDPTDHTQVVLERAESPDGLIVLAGPVVLVAVQRGAQAAYWRLDPRSMRSVDDEQQLEVPVWDRQTSEDPIERKLEVFGPGTWAQWSIGAMGGNGRDLVKSGVQLFRLDESTGRIEDFTTDEVRAASFGQWILGCHRLPNDALVIGVDLVDETSSKRVTALIKIDRNGDVQFPPLRVQGPVQWIGWLRDYDLILYPGVRSFRLSSLRLQPEAVPRTLDSRMPIVDAIGQLGLADGRLLLINETGALILDADPQQIVRIGSPAWGDTLRSLRIYGVLRDGSVVIDEWEGIVEGSWEETASRLRITSRDHTQELPWPARLTRTGCVVRETDASLEVSRSGLDGPFEELIAKDDIRRALGLEEQAAFRLSDAEEDVEGSWAFLIGVGSQEFVLLRNHDGGTPRWFGFFDLRRDQSCEILGFHRSALLIALDTEDYGGTNREHYLIDSARVIEGPPIWTCMRPLYADWCLLWGHPDPWGIERIYLLRAGSGSPPVPVDDLWLAHDSLTVEILPAGNGHVAIAAIEEDGQVLTLHRRELDPGTPALVEGATCQAVLCEADQRDRATCWTKIDDGRIAVGYRSRRCEIIEIPRQSGRTRKVIRAVAYTPEEPTSMILSRGTEGDHLVVSAGGEVFWFGLSDLEDRRTPGW